METMNQFGRNQLFDRQTGAKKRQTLTQPQENQFSVSVANAPLTVLNGSLFGHTHLWVVMVSVRKACSAHKFVFLTIAWEAKTSPTL